MSFSNLPVKYTVIHFQKIFNWFGNNVSKKKSPEGTVQSPKKGTKKSFTIRDVVKVTHKEKIYAAISEETDAPPGQPEWLRHYPTALTAIIDGLTEAELENVEDTAQEWTSNEVPREVQRT
jgi:hypothetical protein